MIAGAFNLGMDGTTAELIMQIKEYMNSHLSLQKTPLCRVVWCYQAAHGWQAIVAWDWHRLNLMPITAPPCSAGVCRVGPGLPGSVFCVWLCSILGRS